MEKNYDFIIVEMATLTAYDYLNKGESKTDAEMRGNRYYIEKLEDIKAIFSNHNSDYWKTRIEELQKKVKAGCKVMLFSEYKMRRRKYLLSDSIKEISADEFHEMLNVLPPLYWRQDDGVEMFCMRERYDGTITNQYMHNKQTDKYYMALVDASDRQTWICERLSTGIK